MYIENFLDYIKHQKRYSEHTILAYSKDIHLFVDYLTESFNIEDLTLVKHIHIRSYIVELMRNAITEKSVNRKISSIRSYFKFLRKKGYIETNPSLNVVAPKIPKRLPNYVKQEETTLLLDRVVDPSDFVSFRNHLILMCFISLGLRRSELINILVGDVNTIGKHLVITGKGNKQRKLPLNERLLEKFDTYINLRGSLEQIQTNHLFLLENGNKLYPKFVYNLVKTSLSEVQTISKKSPHVLRHTFATLLSDNGAQINAIKDLLGHNSLAATQIYTHSSLGALKKAYRSSHPRS